MGFWVLAFSYWIHLLATVVWLGSLSATVLIALPAVRSQTISLGQWLTLQKRLAPWINGCLMLLLITGFVQMTFDKHYSGFLILDSVWAGAMLAKHVAFGGLAAVTIYLQVGLRPAMERLALLAEQKPQLAAAEQLLLQRRESRLLWISAGLAVLISLFTAVMTAV